MDPNLIDFIVRHWLLTGSFFCLLVAYLAFECFRGDDQAKIDPQTLIGLYNRNQAMVLDVRSAPAFKAAHILGSQHVPAEELGARGKKLKKAGSRKIVVVTETGKVAPTILQQLQGLGFADVVQLEGGIHAWKSAGLPLTNEE